MSKSILGIALTVAGLVLIATGVGAPLGTIALGAGLGSISVAALIGVGLELAGSLLLGPSVPKGLSSNSAVSRLYASLVTTEPRKIWFGHTAGATDIRYQTYTGSKQDHYKQVVVHASHEADAIDEIWFDNEKAWTSGGGVQGRYVGYLTVTSRPLGTSANGIAIDSVWTSTCTLTGCAYTYLDYNLLGADSSHPSPFQGGVSNRMTVRGKGAKVYDPRLDSTVTGGSGTQRAGTQSTWAWDDNGSRNPALQLLWYMLGWQINGKLALGMGLPSARIDLTTFITAANICDETVTLADTTTEPRYRSDGVISEGDDRSAVVDQLCAAMNATLRDDNGKIAIQILYNDLATPVADFTLNDILGEENYDQTQPLSSYFNIVRGRQPDPSDNALYQLKDYPEVKLTAPDGIDRIQTIDYPLIQSNGQVQRLGKLRLMRAQFQARYSATFGPRAWQVSLGNVVRLTHGGLNWTTKLFRVVAQGISQNGQVKMTLQEEDASVYSWAAEDIAGTAPGTPTVADPLLNPLVALTLADIQEALSRTYPKNLTIDSIDAGTNATIRLYGATTTDPFTIDYPGTTSDPSVGPSSLTGKAYSTTYYLYADISATAGIGDPSPTLGATTVFGTSLNSSANPYRFALGRVVTTPASGGGATTGSATGGGGYGGGGSGSGGTKPA